VGGPAGVGVSGGRVTSAGEQAARPRKRRRAEALALARRARIEEMIP